MGTGQAARYLRDLVDRASRLDEQHVRAGREVRFTAANDFVHPGHEQGIAAGDDHEIRIRTRRDRGTDLLRGFLERHNRLSRQAPAPLREHLVFQMDRRHAGALIFPHRALHVELVAEAGVRVGNHRHLDRLNDGGRVVDHLAHGDEAQVRHTQAVQRRTTSRHVDGLEPDLLGQLGRHGAERARCNENMVPSKQLAQPGRRSFHQGILFSIQSGYKAPKHAPRSSDQKRF